MNDALCDFDEGISRDKIQKVRITGSRVFSWSKQKRFFVYLPYRTIFYIISLITYVLIDQKE